MTGIICKYIFFLLSIAFALAQSLFSADSTGISKIRLGNSVNAYQPVIQPIPSPDGKYLFLDRKYHPENTGGTNDKDECVVSSITKSGSYSALKSVQGNLNSHDADVLCYIFPSGSKGIVERQESNGRIRFFYSKIENDAIEIESELEFDNDFWLWGNVYISVSPDDRNMILSCKCNSNSDDTIGSSLELYYSQKNGNKWSIPIKITSLSTDLQEESPYLALDARTLYFSRNDSDKKNNLDIYKTSRLDESWLNWSNPIRLPSGINSEFDDYGLSLTLDASRGYMVSNDTASKRKGIYIIDMPQLFRPDGYTVCHIEFERTLKNQNFILQMLKSGVIMHFVDLGYWKNTVVLNSLYDSFYLENSEFISDTIVNDPFSGISIEKIWLNFREKVKDNVFNENIYFDYNSAIPNKTELLRIATLIKENKFYESIEIVGYADTVGTEKYNFKLGLIRAQAIADYFANQGISPSSISVKSNGENHSDYTQSPSDMRKAVVILQKHSK